MKPAIIVHGGAGDWPAELLEAARDGTRRAVEVGWAVLDQGGSALDAVEAAIVVMEDDEAFDAGRGSFLNADGQVELDAGFMNGANLQVGAVAGVQFIQNPIRLARAVMEKSEHVLLVAQGAQRFAQKMGFPYCDLTDLAVPREFERWQQALYERMRGSRPAAAPGAGLPPPVPSAQPDTHRGGTVGCVALDVAGHIAAGTSTGGTPNKMPGRVGDVPMVGCGFYADDELGGVSTTGWGEAIAKINLARLVLHFLEQVTEPQAAAQLAVDVLKHKVNGEGGLVLLTADGRPGWRHNTQYMPRAYRTWGTSGTVVDL